MDEMEFTEAESNMNDLVSEYQQYEVNLFISTLNSLCLYVAEEGRYMYLYIYIVEVSSPL